MQINKQLRRIFQLFFLPLTNNLREEKIWKQLSRKSKSIKIIVICTGLGLLVGGFFLLKPASQTSVKETNLQAEVVAVSKDSVSEKEVKKEEKEEPVEQRFNHSRCEGGC